MADLFAQVYGRSSRSQIMPPAPLLTASLSDVLKVSQTVQRTLVGGGTSPIFQMVTNSGTFPECGWDIETTYPGDGVAPHTKTLVTDGSGPGGRNYVRITFATGGASDGSWGWGLSHSAWMALEAEAVQGSTRYLRWRMRVPTPFSWTNASGGSGTKLLDFCQLAGDTSRAVTQIFGDVIGRLDLYPYKGGGGGPGDRRNDIGTDVWHNCQLKYQSSTTTVSTDAVIASYLGSENDSESTPGQTETGFSWDVEGWPGGTNADSFMQIGSVIAPMTGGSTFVLDFCDFEYDDQFDTNWNNP